MYIYSLSAAVDRGRGLQSMLHYVFQSSPSSTLIQTVHLPLNSLQVLHQSVSNGRISLSGAGPGPRDGLGSVSVSLDRLIGAIPVCAQVAGGAAFFRCACSEPDTSFSGGLGGSKNGGGDERRVEEAEDEELPLSQCHYMNLIQGWDFQLKTDSIV